MKSIVTGNKKAHNDTVKFSKHKPTFDTNSINHAIERAIKDARFLNEALEAIKSMKFPAYKRSITNYLKSKTNDKDTVSLFESLDGYIQYKDLYHIRKSIEQNIPKKKIEHQISNKKRQNPDVRIRETRSNKSMREREAVNPSEERKDYPEVTPTAMSLFICSMCGKEFQNQDDLVHHRRFEGG
jgi:Ca2+-binding EF-hand superfamily protein